MATPVTTITMVVQMNVAGTIQFSAGQRSQATILASTPNGGPVSQAIPTTSTGTAINIGSVSNLGWAWLQNTDATNYVEIGIKPSSTFLPVLRLLPGEAAMVRFSPAASLFAVANTAAVNLMCTIFDA